MEEIHLALLHELIRSKKLKAIPEEPLDKFLRRAGVIVIKNKIQNTVNLSVLDKIGNEEPYLGAESVVPYDQFKLGQLKTGERVLTLSEIWATYPSSESLEGLSPKEVIREWLDAIQSRRPIMISGLNSSTVDSLRTEYKAHIVSGSRLYVNNLQIGETTICFGRTAPEIAKYQKAVLEKAATLFAYAWEQPRKLYRKDGRKLTVVREFSSPDIEEFLAVATVGQPTPNAGS